MGRAGIDSHIVVYEFQHRAAMVELHRFFLRLHDDILSSGGALYP